MSRDRTPRTLTERVRVLSALADPARLAVVDALEAGDHSPGDLAAALGMGTNLLAHHLNVLVEAGVVRRVRSEADRRRSFVALVPDALEHLLPAPPALVAPRVVFVCTQNSARSQLAAALWRARSTTPVASAGTRPARAIHPGAVAVARRHGLDLPRRRPAHAAQVLHEGDLVVSVCDSAHEALERRGAPHLHWSVPDPVRVGTDAAFDEVYADVADRVARLAPPAAGRPETPGAGSAADPDPHPDRIPSDTLVSRPRGAAVSAPTHAEHPEISLDQRLALRAAATNLERHFRGTFGIETIERFLHTSYDQFAGRAAVATWLPLLAERFARIRLTALAKVEGKVTDHRPTVLFLCVHNAGRSQMALGYMRHYAGDDAVAWSGGSEPGSEVNPAAVQAMAEVGIDISGEFPKPWTDEIVRAADVVVTMGCGDACPIFPGTRYEDWVLDDPAGQDVAAVRPIREEIARRVRGLLAELDVPVHG